MARRSRTAIGGRPRGSTPGKLTGALEREILGGKLKPGERLREQELAESFSVSRNSVREALLVLDRKGLVRHTPFRGAQVIELDERDVADIFRARSALEREGAREMRPADARDLLLVEAEGIEAAAAAGDAATLLERDFAFHRALVEQLGSRRLTGLYVDLQRELRLALSQLDSFDMTAQVEEHREIAEALMVRHRALADEILSHHLEVTARRIWGLLAEPS